MKISIISLLLLIALAGCSSNNKVTNSSKPVTKKYQVDPRNLSYFKGREAEKNKRYSEAFNFYKKAAEKGHYLAQLNLAVMYQEGRGTQRNDQKSFYWNKQVVKQAPDPRANFNLGQHYRQGYGVKRDYKKAIINYKIAAKQGHADASNSLGYMYRNGLGIKANKQIARDYYIEAATKGNVYAINNLGTLAQSEGDYRRARQWYRKAANKGHKVAIKNLANLGSRGY